MLNDIETCIGIAAGWCSITPSKQVPLGAFKNARAGESFQQVDLGLEANAVMLRKQEENVFLVSVDTLYLTSEFEADVLKAAGLPRCKVFLFASHTHFAPLLDRTKPGLGTVDAEYYAFTVRQVAQLLRRLEQTQVSECAVFHERIKNTFSVNRRKFVTKFDRRRFTWQKKMLRRPNLKGPVDPFVHVLTGQTSGGQPKCVIWTCGCHPVEHPGLNNVSSEFPGVVRQHLREQYDDEDLPVVFLQGFSGDVRPTAFRRTAVQRPFGLLRNPVSAFRGGGKFEAFSNAEYAAWSSRLAKAVRKATTSKTSCIENGTLRCLRYSLPLQEILLGGRPANVEFAQIWLSPTLVMLAISAEVAAQYTELLKTCFGGETEVICVGCFAGTFGYLPTDQMICEGGYEADGFLQRFPLEGKFHEATEQIVMSKVQEHSS